MTIAPPSERIFEQDDRPGAYVFNLHQGEMPASSGFTVYSLDELENRMRAFQPDLRKWHTTDA